MDQAAHTTTIVAAESVSPTVLEEVGARREVQSKIKKKNYEQQVRYIN
jgi:hypothetical protein